MRVLSIFGTRPEAIKMAPVVRELQRQPRQAVESLVCVTAQHRQMLDQVLSLFGIEPDIDLDLMEERQSLVSLSARALHAVTDALNKLIPDVVLVQGDTTTAMVASLAAFYRQIPVGHVEAGLRSGNRYRPFPEEMNRRLIGTLATYHFAPTERAAAALRAEGVQGETVHVTGNPVIDALRLIQTLPVSREAAALVGSLDSTRRIILVTAHRRENFGEPLEQICEALRMLAARNADIEVLYPVHMNPHVQDTVVPRLRGLPRIRLVPPLAYETLVRVMASSTLILTDSGGLQEEAPALGKPVLVLRSETERPEAVEAGTVKVIGTDTASIVSEAEHLLHNADAYRHMASAVSPYGDGRAAERIVHILREAKQCGEG